MEASTVPRAAPARVSTTLLSPQLLRLASDARLVALVRQRRAGAFEAVYDRHHRGILSFCRHMLGDPQEAEDAVQHTFLSAYNDLISSEKQIHLRAWLFAIARNRCCSLLRTRREQPAGDLGEPVTEGLASQVQRRQDLRDLVMDMQRLPDDQRAALVMAEIEALSHEQIGRALGVPRDKVKALVFQARESLVATRTARETDCAEIREALSTLRGGALRRANLRRHLRECAGCREFGKQVQKQRHGLATNGPATNGTATNGTATNGTATNGTATNGTATDVARGGARTSAGSPGLAVVSGAALPGARASGGPTASNPAAATFRDAPSSGPSEPRLGSKVLIMPDPPRRLGTSPADPAPAGATPAAGPAPIVSVPVSRPSGSAPAGSPPPIGMAGISTGTPVVVGPATVLGSAGARDSGGSSHGSGHDSGGGSTMRGGGSSGSGPAGGGIRGQSSRGGGGEGGNRDSGGSGGNGSGTGASNPDGAGSPSRRAAGRASE